MSNEPLKSEVAIYPASSSPNSYKVGRCPDGYEMVFKLQYKSVFIRNFGRKNSLDNYIFVILILINKMEFFNEI